MNILKDKFTDKAIDISESLELLLEIIRDTINEKSHVSEAIYENNNEKTNYSMNL